MILKPNTYPSQKMRVVRIETTRTQKFRHVPFIDGLCKIHVVMCLKLGEVHAKKVN